MSHGHRVSDRVPVLRSSGEVKDNIQSLCGHNVSWMTLKSLKAISLTKFLTLVMNMLCITKYILRGGI